MSCWIGLEFRRLAASAMITSSSFRISPAPSWGEWEVREEEEEGILTASNEQVIACIKHKKYGPPYPLKS